MNLNRCRGTRKRSQGLDQSPRSHRRARTDRRASAWHPGLAQAAHPGRRQVVQRFAGPFERRNHVLLVEPRTLEEFAVFALDEVRQFDRQQQLEAHARMLEKFVVQHRPQQGPHRFGGAVDQMRLVDPIDQHDDPGVAERLQNALQLDEQFVAVVGALLVGQRLAR